MSNYKVTGSTKWKQQPAESIQKAKVRRCSELLPLVNAIAKLLSLVNTGNRLAHFKIDLTLELSLT
jgi:hypothetical protein